MPFVMLLQVLPSMVVSLIENPELDVPGMSRTLQYHIRTENKKEGAGKANWGTAGSEVVEGEAAKAEVAAEGENKEAVPAVEEVKVCIMIQNIIN